MRLEQSATSRPFPGEFVPFAFIAVLTTQNQVAHIVSRDTRSRHTGKWEGMFNMVKILPFSLLMDTRELGKSTSSIITSVFLAFQLLKNLSMSIGTKSCLEESDTFASSDIKQLSMGLIVTLMVQFSILTSIFQMRCIPCLSACLSLFSMVCPINRFILSQLFTMPNTVPSIFCKNTFPMLWILPLFVGSFFRSVFRLLTQCRSAFLAFLLQFIASLSVEVLSCGRKKAPTRACTRFAGNRIVSHCLTPLVSSLCCVLPGSQGHSSSAWFMTPSLGNIHEYTFFPMACKAETLTAQTPIIESIFTDSIGRVIGGI